MVIQREPQSPVWNAEGQEAFAQTRRILIVEDDETLGAMLHYTLQKHGYQVVLANNGRAARPRARTIQPDLVVLDLMLKQVDGHDVGRVLRNWSDIPILMLTALGQENDIVTGLEAGADDYVTKPFSMRALLARIKAFLRRPRIQQGDDEVLLSRM